MPEIVGRLPLGQERDAACGPGSTSSFKSSSLVRRAARRTRGRLSTLERRGDRPDRRRRVVGLGDRAADDQDRGAVVDRLRAASRRASGRPRRRPSGRTPGTTKKPSGQALRAAPTSSPEQTMPSRPALAGELRRGARPARPGCRRLRSAARSFSSRLVRTVTATTLVFGERGGLGVLEHRPAAGGVDGQDRRLQRRQRLDRLGDGVGDVVQLQVEEDRQAELAELGDARGAVGGEEFEAELEPAGDAAHGPRDGAARGPGRACRSRRRSGSYRRGSSSSAGAAAGAERLLPLDASSRRRSVHSRARWIRRSAGSRAGTSAPSRTGILMSTWMSPHRFERDVGPVAAGEQRDEHGEKHPEQGLQKLHRRAPVARL